MPAGTSVFMRLVGVDEASPAFLKAAASAETSSTRMTRAFKGAMKGAAQLGLAFGAFELGKKAFDIGKEAVAFQRDMTMVQTQAGASAAEVKTFTGALLSMSGKVAQSPEELATSLYHSYSALKKVGASGPQILNTVKIAAEGAAIGNTDLEDTTNSLTATLASGIVPFNQAGKAMGMLNAIVGTGDMKFSDLNEALGTGLLVTMGTLGTSLQDAGAALAVFGDNNVRGADAATKLRMSVQDLVKPAAHADEVLAQVGLTSDKLRTSMEKHGLVATLDLLKKRMDAVGITGAKVGGFLVDAFTKKAGVGLAVLLTHMPQLHESLDAETKLSKGFGAAWQAASHTVSFEFRSLSQTVDSAGVALAMKLMPALGHVANLLMGAVKTGISVVTGALHPFVSAWQAIDGPASTVVSALSKLRPVLAPLTGAFKGIAVAVGAAWLAFKGIGLVSSAISAVRGAVTALATTVRADLGAAGSSIRGFGAAFTGAGTESALAAKQLQADSLAVAAAAEEERAAVATAKAQEAAAYRDAVIASGVASKEMEADAAAVAVALQAEAEVATASAAEIGAASTAAAAEVDAAAAAAEIGWTGMLGPLAAVGIGITALVTMFHHSKTASQEATDAAKDYTAALKGGYNATTVLSTTLDHMAKSNVPEQIDALNKSLSGTKISGDQFVAAITKGGKPLTDLRAHLQNIIDTNTKVAESMLAVSNAAGEGPSAAEAAAEARAAGARKLLDFLNTQNVALSKAAQKELELYKSANLAAGSVDKVSQSAKLASGTVAEYAGMVGDFADKNGIVAMSQKDLAADVNLVKGAFENATTSGQEFLDALDKFSKSGATAQDRATLIGETLKYANGDALAFAGAMTQTTSAVDSMTGAFKQQRDTLAQQSAEQQKASQGVVSAQGSLTAAQQRVAAAQARVNELRGKSKTKASELKSAEASLTSAQNSASSAATSLADAQSSANQQQALAYRDTERAAIRFDKAHGHLTATIKTSAKGAGDLVTQLQGIQTAAMAAASATYQHEKAQKGGKKAAEDAYNIYVTKTQGALVDNAKQLGLTNKQAKAFSDTYFGIKNAGNIKKTIEAEGANSLVNVLKQLGRLLARLTGQPWNININRNIKTNVYGNEVARFDPKSKRWIGPYAPREMGGPVIAGMPYVVGEKRAELFIPDSNGHIEPRVPSGGHRIVVEKQELHVHYPLDGGLNEALPQLMRMSAQKLGELV